MRLNIVQSILNNEVVLDVEHIWGKNADVDQAAAEDLVDTGANLAVPSNTAAAVKVVSGSANDDGDPAGTGARTVKVWGLDANFRETSEDVTMNGTTAVTTTTLFTRIFGAKVLTVGSGGTNAGAITVTNAAGSATHATIAANADISYQGHYTIPAGYNGYILAANTLASDAIMIMVKDYSETIWKPIYKLGSENQIDYPIKLAPKTDIKLRSGIVGADNTSLEAWMQVALKAV